MSTTKKQTHYSAIDSVRGLSALAVLIAHVNHNWMPHAQILMDTFFTISAFLITSTLIENIKKNGNISLLTFTKRRLLRLYPALIFCVTTYVTIAYFIVEDFKFIINDAFFTLIYLSNLNKLTDYIYPDFFTHTWSLSIEEQFYLIWPSLLTILLINKSIWEYKIPILILILFTSITWRFHLVNDGAELSRLYYGSDTRIDAFIAGGLLAFMQERLNILYKNKYHFKVILAFLVILLAIALYYWNPKVVTYFKWQQPIILFLSCALIFITTRNDNNIFEKIFSPKIFQWLGVRCYGIYLWHWPLIWLFAFTTEIYKPLLLLIVLPFSLFMAWFSYKYIEEPILRRRPKMPYS